MLYEYKALNVVGDEVSGIVEADDTNEAVSKIRDKQLFPTKVKTRERMVDVLENCSRKKSFDFYSIVPKTIMEKVMLVIISLLLVVITILVVV